MKNKDSMEVIYNVKYRFKNNEENKNNEELKYLFNQKLLNMVLKLENNKLELKKVWLWGII